MMINFDILLRISILSKSIPRQLSSDVSDWKKNCGDTKTFYLLS